MTDRLADLWVRQHHDAVPLDPDALARVDARVRARLRRRDAIEYAAGAVAAGAFVYMALHTPDWGVRIGCAALILGVAVTLFNLWRRRPEPLDAAFGAPSLGFHRALLAAQRDMLASVWRWYILPVVPGMVLLLIAILRVTAEHMPFWAALLGIGAAAVPVAAVFWGIHRLNLAAARQLQRMLDALDQDAH